ncbi:MAG: hypothetical protein H0W64_01195 [Gammaproteobacteria bacterium]|nr:hypothetical protein [Gammaproteobacteria bacterium]
MHRKNNLSNEAILWETCEGLLEDADSIAVVDNIIKYKSFFIDLKNKRFNSKTFEGKDQFLRFKEEFANLECNISDEISEAFDQALAAVVDSTDNTLAEARKKLVSILSNHAKIKSFFLEHFSPLFSFLDQYLPQNHPIVIHHHNLALASPEIKEQTSRQDELININNENCEIVKKKRIQPANDLLQIHPHSDTKLTEFKNELRILTKQATTFPVDSNQIKQDIQNIERYLLLIEKAIRNKVYEMSFINKSDQLAWEAQRDYLASLRTLQSEAKALQRETIAKKRVLDLEVIIINKDWNVKWQFFSHSIVINKNTSPKKFPTEVYKQLECIHQAKNGTIPWSTAQVMIKNIGARASRQQASFIGSIFSMTRSINTILYYNRFRDAKKQDLIVPLKLAKFPKK